MDTYDIKLLQIAKLDMFCSIFFRPFVDHEENRISRKPDAVGFLSEFVTIIAERISYFDSKPRLIESRKDISMMSLIQSRLFI